MDPQRRKVREKRYRNRMRIGFILFGLGFLLMIISAIVTGGMVFYPGFFFLVGAAYLIAGIWEKKELNSNQDQ